MSGLGVGRLGEWMYDVAVSSIDADNIDARGPGYESLRRKRVLSSVGFEDILGERKQHAMTSKDSFSRTWGLVVQ